MTKEERFEKASIELEKIGKLFIAALNEFNQARCLLKK